MKIVILLCSVLFFASIVNAQEASPAADKEAAYTKTITTRAEKIVAPLGISNTAKQQRVTALVVGQYRALNAIYTQRDEKVKALKQAANTEKETLAAAIKSTEETTATTVAGLQKNYLKNLSAELTEDQVVKIKDGMTYGVLPITYSGYLDMLPNLTKEQQTQIMTWLLEARDYAMSAESSDKKHWWFGKYKGRINNYLSAQGYDLNKESQDWHKRIAEREKEKSQ